MTRHRSASPGKQLVYVTWILLVFYIKYLEKLKITILLKLILFDIDCPFVRDVSDNIPLLTSATSSSNIMSPQSDENNTNVDPSFDRVGK